MPDKLQKYLKINFDSSLFKYLFQSHPLPILIYELKSFAIKNVNKAAIQKYGYNKSKFLKLKITDLYLRESHKKPFRKIINDNLQKHKIKNGKAIDVQITKNKIVYEGVVCELMIIQDVTKHINLENKLIEAESELKTTLYSIGDGVITTDNNGRVVMMNPVAEKLTGWKEKDAKGKKLELVFNIINENTRRKVVNPVKRVLREGIVVGLANHTVLISKDKKERPILDCGAPIKDKAGKTTGVVLVFRDQTKEREAQRKIEEAKVFAESIIATVREPLIVLDSKMNVIKANRAYYKIFKTSENETAGKSFYKLGNGQWNIPELKLLLEKILPLNTSFENFEVQYKFPHLGLKTLLLNARRIYKESNKTEMILLAIEDITERKKAEELLKRSSELYSTLIESSEDAIYLVDKDCRYLYMNKRYLMRIGKNLEEVIGKHYSEFHTPEGSRDFEEKIKKVCETGIAVVYEYQSNRDGRYFIRTLSPVKDSISNEVNAVVIISKDITHLKEVEKALKESEERFRNIYESLTIGVYRTTPDGKLLMANPTFLSMLGYDSLEEAQSKIVMEEVYAEKGTRDLFLKIIMEEGIVYGFEQKWKRADGKVIYIRENARAYKNKDGSIAYFEGTAEDITTKKLAEEELIIAKEKAEQTDKLKSYFLAQISHEIRTPLNVIVSFCNLIKEEIQNNITPEFKEYFNSIDLASKRIIRTIDLILNMSAVQSGAYIPTYRLINIKSDIIEKLVPEFKKIAENKGLAFYLDYKTDKLNLFADDYSVSQIFSNLIDNAIKYTNNGSVEIVIERNQDDKLTIKVMDTGIGMSEDFLKNIFQPFTQEEQGYTRKYEGSGLGLALVKKYCELNKADINVVSKKGEGTTFTVVFS